MRIKPSTLLFALLLCVNFTIFSQSHPYSENVSFKVEEINENTSLATGHQSWVWASRGNKFVLVTLSLDSDTSTKDEVDFDKFHLLNPKTQTKHRVEFVRTAGLIQFSAKLKLDLKKKTKKRVLVFLYPENDTPKVLSINDLLVEL